MLLGIVEAVVVVGNDLPGVGPRTFGTGSLGKPDLAEHRRAERLRDHHDPALPIIVPINRAVLGQHRFASFDVDQVDGRLAGCDFLIGDQFVHLLVIQLRLPFAPFEFQAAVRVSLHTGACAGLQEGIGLVPRGIEVACDVCTHTHQRHSAGEVNVLVPVIGTVQKRMTVGIERRIFREHGAVPELLPLIVELHHSTLVNRQGRLDFYVLCQQPGLPVFVR